MREIKFRGKTIDNYEWIYGFLSFDETDNSYFITTIFEEGGSMVMPETIGQSTGLKDKNGKEIYEGDIVLVERKYGEDDYLFPPIRSVAKLFGWGGEFEFVNSKNKPTPYRNDDMDFEIYDVPMSHTSQNCREIIGNVHDKEQENAS